MWNMNLWIMDLWIILQHYWGGCCVRGTTFDPKRGERKKMRNRERGGDKGGDKGGGKKVERGKKKIDFVTP